ncbi:hypothetical protein FNV43_RR02027 [Rhamnella rubrinervis]|uniref:Exostosin GT47 domain-containing protein n=1 Tax=Rhamnella rubrinervis TaxID=2594499 RepID=A0A8K0MTT1_9ROSA|nr:hypothetical protein FNV43_RR02027 [Rhamnella rubrinervis]
MEKQMVVGKYCYNNPIWSVILSSFLFCFIYFLLDFSTLTRNHNFTFPNFLDIHQKPKPLSSYTSQTTNIINVPGNQTSTPILTRNETKNDHHDHESVHLHPAQSLNVTDNNMTQNGTTATTNHFDSCSGRYIYIQDLPRQFNEDLLNNCRIIEKSRDMCPFLSNEGFGTKLEDNDSKRVFTEKDWFLTSQFSLEVIFHNRMKKYKCLTNDSSMASGIFVPYYSGLDAAQYLLYNVSVRDASAQKLVDFLAKRPEWKTMWGRDHFMIGGRVAWDYRRQTDNEKDWGSKLMFLPESKNMTLLSIESSLWNNDIGIPYPTYFHPSKESVVFDWQERMRKRERRYLFSFAGAPRPGAEYSIRSELINQCKSSTEHCKFMACDGSNNHCENPEKVMGLFQNSIFCLQPSGDSFTRRSTFDSILAGCIPVFFDPASAYTQYLWHLPTNFSKYSVFISKHDIKEKRVSISERLLGVPTDEIFEMQEEVTRMIPKIIYGNWTSGFERKLEDAFDIAVNGMLERVEKVRKKIKDGEDPSEGFGEVNNGKFDLLWKSLQ